MVMDGGDRSREKKDSRDDYPVLRMFSWFSFCLEFMLLSLGFELV